MGNGISRKARLRGQLLLHIRAKYGEEGLQRWLRGEVAGSKQAYRVQHGSPPPSPPAEVLEQVAAAEKKQDGSSYKDRRRGVVQFLVARDGASCALCNRPLDPAYATIDHVIARRDGGTDDTENLKLAHRVCNVIRGHMPFETGRASVTPESRKRMLDRLRAKLGSEGMVRWLKNEDCFTPAHAFARASRAPKRKGKRKK